MPNDPTRRSWDGPAMAAAEDNFYANALKLAGLIEQRSGDVKTAMANYEATGVSESYAGKEAQWEAAANRVLKVIRDLLAALQANDNSARQAMQRAQAAVDAIA